MGVAWGSGPSSLHPKLLSPASAPTPLSHPCGTDGPEPLMGPRPAPNLRGSASDRPSQVGPQSPSLRTMARVERSLRSLPASSVAFSVRWARPSAASFPRPPSIVQTGGDGAGCWGLGQCAFIDASDGWLGSGVPALTRQRRRSVVSQHRRWQEGKAGWGHPGYGTAPLVA